MFSAFHLLWLLLCALFVSAVLILCRLRRPSLQTVLSLALLLSLLSEGMKIFSVTSLVPSENGSLLLPYIQLNHLPLHFCSVQLLLIARARFCQDPQRRRALLTFMAPTCLLGGCAALLMPSIFSTTISPDQAFTSPVSYQFFLFHSVLVCLGLLIVRSGEITWTWKSFRQTLLTVYLLGAASIYVNSLLASPRYRDGQLISVDFWTNFFFTYQNPLGIPITRLWQWQLYLLLLCAAAALCLLAFYLPLMAGKRRFSPGSAGEKDRKL